MTLPGPTTPLKIGEVAKLLGWPSRRVRRMLDRIEATYPGSITFVGITRERHVTLATLRKFWPDAGLDIPTPDGAGEMFTQLKELSVTIGRNSGAILSLAQRLVRCEQGLEEMRARRKSGATRRKSVDV